MIDIAIFSPRKAMMWGALFTTLSIFILIIVYKMIIVDNIPFNLISMIIEDKIKESGLNKNYTNYIYYLSFLILLLPLFFLYHAYHLLRYGVMFIKIYSLKNIFLKADRGTFLYNHPDIDGPFQWGLKLKKIEINTADIEAWETVTSRNPFQYPPEFSVVFKMRDGSNITVDCIYFKENLTEISENIKRVLEFKGKDIKKLNLVKDDIAMAKNMPDNAKSIIDDNGRFIPPGEE